MSFSYRPCQSQWSMGCPKSRNPKKHGYPTFILPHFIATFFLTRIYTAYSLIYWVDDHDIFIPYMTYMHIYIHAMGCVSKLGTTTEHQNAAAPRRDHAAEEMDGQWTPHVDGVVGFVKNKEHLGEIDWHTKQKINIWKKTKHARILSLQANPVSTLCTATCTVCPYLFNVCNLRLCMSYFTLTVQKTELSMRSCHQL